MFSRNKFIITIEGLPGSGKTSVLKYLSRTINANFVPEIVSTETSIRTNDFYIKNDISKSNLSMKRKYPISIQDRDFLSTLAFNYAYGQLKYTDDYQKTKNKINHLCEQGKITQPDIYIYLSAKKESSLSRQKPENYGRLWTDPTFLGYLEDFYENNIAKYGSKFYVIKSDGNLSSVRRECESVIKKEIKKRFYNPVFFDLDGTIINSTQLVVKSYQHAIRQLCNINVSAERIKKLQGLTVEEIIHLLFPQSKIDIKKLSELLIQFELKNAKRYGCVYDGMIELLEFLRKIEIPVGLITSRGPVTTKAYIYKFNIARYFDVIAHSECTVKNKPYADPINYAIKKTVGEAPIMIGDSPHDLNSARNAQIVNAGVTWGYYAAKQLQREKPDYILNKPSEIYDILKI